eukprot:8570730-Ditylum_brightwellii.AAC.1
MGGTIGTVAQSLYRRWGKAAAAIFSALQRQDLRCLATRHFVFSINNCTSGLGVQTACSAST